MANEKNKVLYMPFDEGDGSLVAFDYTKNRADGVVSNCEIVPGTVGNAIKFAGEDGRVELRKDISPDLLDGNFSLLFFAKPLQVEVGSPKKLVLTVAGEGVSNFISQEIPIQPDAWTHIAIVRDGAAFHIYVNNSLYTTAYINGTITGLSLDQDYYGGDLVGLGLLDDVKLFNKALSEVELDAELHSSSAVEYYIDGVNLKDYGVYVSSSKGLVSRPKMKTPLSESWANYHGKMIDLNHKFVEERSITLNCFIKTTEGKGGYARQLNKFLRVFDKKGTHRLLCNIHPTHPLVFEVYMDAEIDPDKTWNDDVMVGTFALKLKEPLPVKRVLLHMCDANASEAATIKLTTNKVLNVYWGDGEVTYDVTGNNVELSHTYTASGNYYIVIAGVIEEITDFETNAIVVWQKI